MKALTCSTAWPKNKMQKYEDKTPLWAIFFVTVGSLFFGLASVVLGPGSWIGLIGAVMVLSTLIFALITLVAGTNGKDWATTIVLFIICLIMEGIIRRRELSSAGLDGQTIVKLMVWGGGLLIGITHRKYLISALKRSTGLLLIALFAIWALITCTYSLSPAYSFGGGFAFIALVVFIGAIIEERGIDYVILPMVYACGILVVSALILYAAAPSLVIAQTEGGKIPRLAGLTGSPNNLGRVASLGILFIFFAAERKIIRYIRIDTIIIATACIGCLALSWSRTSIIGTAIAIAIVKLRKRPFLALLLTSTLLFIFLSLLISDFNWNKLVRLLSRRGSIEELLTFTGRTSIWEFNWDKFLQSPLLGYGYGATRILIPDGFHTYLGWTTTSAHNLFLQTLVTTGLIGGVLILSTHIWQASMFFKAPNDLADSLFIYIFISGLFEAGAIGPTPNMLTLVWIIALAVTRTESRNHSAQHYAQAA